MTAAEHNFDIIIGGNVRVQRNIAGKSQTQVADYLGISYQQLQKAEKGANRFGAGRLQIIAAYLKCSITDLYVGTGVKEKAPADNYRTSKQGVKLCKDMGMLSKATQRAFASLIGSLANPQ